MWRMIIASFNLYFYFIKVRLRFKRSKINLKHLITATQNAANNNYTGI